LGYNVRLILAGTGEGSVTVATTGYTHTYSSPHCAPSGGACIVAEYDGLVVPFSAKAAPGSVFSGWLGTDCTGTQTVCFATGNGQMWAKFDRKAAPDIVIKPVDHQLSLDTEGTGKGTITGDAIPAGAPVLCPTTCSPTFLHGTLVSLHAAAS